MLLPPQSQSQKPRTGWLLFCICFPHFEVSRRALTGMGKLNALVMISKKLTVP